MVKLCFFMVLFTMPLCAIGPSNPKPFTDLGKRLCQQIAGYSSENIAVLKSCKKFVTELVDAKINIGERLNKKILAIDICENSPNFPWKIEKTELIEDCLKIVIRHFSPDLE